MVTTSQNNTTKIRMIAEVASRLPLETRIINRKLPLKVVKITTMSIRVEAEAEVAKNNVKKAIHNRIKKALVSFIMSH